MEIKKLPEVISGYDRNYLLRITELGDTTYVEYFTCPGDKMVFLHTTKSKNRDVAINKMRRWLQGNYKKKWQEKQDFTDPRAYYPNTIL